MLLDIIDSYDKSLLSAKEKAALESFIQNTRYGEVISIDNFISISEEKSSFNERIEYNFMLDNGMIESNASKSNRCLIGKGSSHGCCGNYEGCCYYRHMYCYVHDKLCTNCTPSWFCFNGCVPDPHRDNLPPGYDPPPGSYPSLTPDKIRKIKEGGRL